MRIFAEIIGGLAIMAALGIGTTKLLRAFARGLAPTTVTQKDEENDL